MVANSDEYIIKGSDQASGPLRKIGQSIESLRSQMMSVAAKTIPDFEQKLFMAKLRAANDKPYLDAIKNRGEKMKELGQSMTTTVTAPIMGAFALGLRNEMMLEPSLIKMEQRWKESKESVRGFVEQIRSLNRDIPISIVQFANLANTMASYKMSKDEIIAAFPVVGKAIRSSPGSDPEQVTRAVIQMNKGAGRDLSELSKTATQAVRINQNGASWESIEKWGNIGLLRNFQKIKPEEIMAMTEMLGEQSKEAMENVDNFYEGLTEAMTDVQKQLEEAAKKDKKYLGLLDKFGGKDRKINSITEFLQAISDLKLDVSKFIEDDESKKPIMALIPRLKEYQEMVKSYETMDTGFLEQIASRMDESTVLKYQAMISSFVDLSIQLANAGVVDEFKRIADSIKEMSIELEKFSPGTTAALVKVLMGLSLAGPAIITIGATMKLFADIYPKLMAAKAVGSLASGGSAINTAANAAALAAGAGAVANTANKGGKGAKALGLMRSGAGFSHWLLTAAWAGMELGEIINELEAQKEANMSPIDKIRRQKDREMEAQRWTTNFAAGQDNRLKITAELPSWLKITPEFETKGIDFEAIPKDNQGWPL